MDLQNFFINLITENFWLLLMIFICIIDRRLRVSGLLLIQSIILIGTDMISKWYIFIPLLIIFDIMIYTTYNWSDIKTDWESKYKWKHFYKNNK